MQKFIKSIFAITAILCFMASAAFAAPKDELDALLKDMNKVNNGRLNMKVNGKFLDDTFDGIAKINFESKPLTLMRGEVDFNVYDGETKKTKKKSYEFYVEDNDKEYTYYYTEKGKNKWYKDSVKNDDKETEKDAFNAAASKLDTNAISELTETVEYDTDFMGQANRGDKAGYKVTVDVAKFLEIVSNVALEGAKKEDAENIKAFAEVAKELPPLSYTVIGDTKKREILSVHMPLTNFLQTSGQKVMNSNKLDPMMKVVAAMALSGSELDIQAEGKDYNKVKVEKLSDNIKKNAKQVEDKKTDKK